MACTFVHVLPASIQQHIQSASTLIHCHLRSYWPMPEHLGRGTCGSSCKSHQSKHVLPTVGPSARIKCYRCNGPNHLARDCRQKGQVTRTCYYHYHRCQEPRHVITLYGKRAGGQYINTSLSPLQDVNAALPVVMSLPPDYVNASLSSPHIMKETPSN
ncbi:CNBP [Acanthosepion pharaonis]|uniref:CNBP n=1 Tax=Acanthosepion pharaonis TaxID=158019 RepID=A0A812CU79_ACAPH|nr:CNBP [Sepia pharaonis]